MFLALNVAKMAVAPAITLVLEVSLKIEATYQGWQSRKTKGAWVPMMTLELGAYTLALMGR